MFHNIATNIDIITKEVLDQDFFKTGDAKKWDKIVNATGDFSNVNPDPVRHWIGAKGEEGALVKQDVKGVWYVDQALLKSDKGLDFEDYHLSDNDKRELIRSLLMAKEIQEVSIVDPLDDGAGFSPEKFADVSQLNIAKNQGKLSEEEFMSAIQAVDFAPNESPELLNLMDYISNKEVGDTLGVNLQETLDLIKLIK